MRSLNKLFSLSSVLLTGGSLLFLSGCLTPAESSSDGNTTTSLGTTTRSDSSLDVVTPKLEYMFNLGEDGEVGLGVQKPLTQFHLQSTTNTNFRIDAFGATGKATAELVAPAAAPTVGWFVGMDRSDDSGFYIKMREGSATKYKVIAIPTPSPSSTSKVSIFANADTKGVLQSSFLKINNEFRIFEIQPTPTTMFKSLMITDQGSGVVPAGIASPGTVQAKTLTIDNTGNSTFDVPAGMTVAALAVATPTATPTVVGVVVTNSTNGEGYLGTSTIGAQSLNADDLSYFQKNIIVQPSPTTSPATGVTLEASGGIVQPGQGWRQLGMNRFVFSKKYVQTDSTVNTGTGACTGSANTAGTGVLPWSNGYSTVTTDSIPTSLSSSAFSKFWHATITLIYTRFNHTLLGSSNNYNSFTGFFFGLPTSTSTNFSFTYPKADAYTASRVPSGGTSSVDKTSNDGDPFWDATDYPTYPNVGSDSSNAWNDFAGSAPSAAKNGIVADAKVRQFWNIIVQNGQARPYILKVSASSGGSALQVSFPCILPSSVASSAYAGVEGIENIWLHIDAKVTAP